MIGRHRWSVLGVAAAAVGVGRFAVPRPAPGPEVVVYKSPSCGCCKKWVEHVQATGFRVTVHDTTNLTAVAEHYGVPHKLTACHTAVVDGYVVEGHVPADVIQRLLKERPGIAGVAVAGMPAGSPGMESDTPAKYYILTFDKNGATSVYGSR